MVNLRSLRMSLTKNGAFKSAELLKEFPANEMLEHCDGEFAGIDLVPSQLANLFDIDPLTHEAPDYLEQVRAMGHDAIDAFVVATMLFGHNSIIEAMIRGANDRVPYTGEFTRQAVGSKAFTNYGYALWCFGLANYGPGLAKVEYDLRPAVFHLRGAAPQFRRMLERKMRRCGWRSVNFFEECRELEFNKVLAMPWDSFESLLIGRLQMLSTTTPFGIRRLDRFESPFA